MTSVEHVIIRNVYKITAANEHKMRGFYERCACTVVLWTIHTVHGLLFAVKYAAITLYAIAVLWQSIWNEEQGFNLNIEHHFMDINSTKKTNMANWQATSGKIDFACTFFVCSCERENARIHFNATEKKWKQIWILCIERTKKKNIKLSSNIH